MNALREFLANGPQRRAWLNDKAENALAYLAGPHLAPKLQSAALVVDMFNPVTGLVEAGQGARQAYEGEGWNRLAGIGRMTSGMAATLAPMAGSASGTAKVMDSLLGWNPTRQAAGDTAGRFAADESGAIKAYHGSPHDYAAERLVEYPDGRQEFIEGFPDILPDVPEGARVLRDYPLGRMRLDKIGTGEGAQAYGHGLYSAENEGVARSYRDGLSSGVRGVDAPKFKSMGGALPHVAPDTAHDIAEGGMPALRSRLAEVEAVIDDPNVWLEHAKVFGVDDAERGLKPWVQEYQDLKMLLESGDLSTIDGRMYEVNIHANPDDFLDWDKPLSEQGPKVRDIWDDFTQKWTPENTVSSDGGQLRGRDFLGEYSSYKPHNPADPMDYRRDFSTEMRDAGIPGIKYLDQGSRGAGEGSRNYVVFDDSLIEIVKKYGIAAAAPLLGMTTQEAQAAWDNQQQQQSATDILRYLESL